MSKKVKIDPTDKAILRHLSEDSRRSYSEIADDIKVSTGTIHGRITKLKDSGVITGSKITIDYEKIGLEVTCFIGVNLRSPKDFDEVLYTLERLEEVVDAYYTTGQYSLFVKVMVPTTRDLHIFLIEKLQRIEGIQSTETLISLDHPISRMGDIGQVR